MRTHLGASNELASADQLPEGWTRNCRLLHCEGYCLYKLDLTRGAMQTAKQSGAEVQCLILIRSKTMLLHELLLACIEGNLQRKFLASASARPSEALLLVLCQEQVGYVTASGTVEWPVDASKGQL